MENTPEDLAISPELDNAPDAVQQWLKHKQRATESSILLLGDSEQPQAQ